MTRARILRSLAVSSARHYEVLTESYPRRSWSA